MFYSFTNHLLSFVLSTIGGLKMNETQLLFSQTLHKLRIIQEIIAIEDIKENTTGTENEGSFTDKAKLSDFHFR